MRFYFNWLNPEDESGIQIDTHARQALELETDLQVLDFSITQREGEIALCQLSIPLTAELKPYSYTVLSVQIENIRTTLFKGKLMDIPVQINDYQQRIELWALPVDYQEQLERIRNQIQQSADWDELFVDPAQRQDPVEALEAIPYLFCWNPRTHNVSLSHLFQGSQTKIYDCSKILQNSLSIKVAGLPKPYINVSVVAEWVQEAAGEINAFPCITKKFVGEKINTLTARGLLANWPRSGQLLGRSGYVVLESSLTTVFPNSTGSLNLYPSITEKIKFSEENTGGVHLQRSWFTGKLKLGWSYRQRRREIVTFRLNHQSRLLQRSASKKLNITLRLGDITKDLPSAAAASFFDTERGKKVVQHALKIARCHLAASARGIEVVFKVPLEQALSLTMDDSIEIHHHAFPNKIATGKLIGYKIFVSFEKIWVQLKVAITTGRGETELPPTIECTAQTLIEGLPDVEELDLNYFIEKIKINNQATEQIDFIKQTDLKKLGDLQQLLKSYPTEISLKMKDIRSVDVLERHFSVVTPLNWSAP